MANPTENTPPGALSTRMATTVKILNPIADALAARGKISPEEINLADGESSLMKLEMVEICKEAMNNSITTDTFSNPVGFIGDVPMKEALAQYFTTYFHPTIPVTMDNIVPTAGSGNAIDALIFTLCDAGDAVLCPAPWWCKFLLFLSLPFLRPIHIHIDTGGYGPYARVHAEVNVIPAFIKPSPSLSWTTESLSSAIIPALEAAYNSAPDPKRIKAVLTSNPNNPMMNCWPEDVVRQIMDFCQDHNLHYISDEVFANTVFDLEADQFVSALSLLKRPDRHDESVGVKSIIEPTLVHVLWSVTKDFGACGVRAGCVLSYHPLVRAGVSFASVWQVSSLAAHFTRSILTSPSTLDLLSSTRSQLAQSFQTCREILSVPELTDRIQLLHTSVGFWTNAVVMLKESENIQDIIVKAKQKGVIVGWGAEFAPLLQKGQGLIKITFAMPQDVLRKGLERLRASLL
ncbi:pyridoxal phosphate-dependent transferase [Talaromyces proteolyticus]|uniref:Pyridoxal phosphate-dependent transferase n=1 Tax=Talaromyces proteolyticus TaxID=1131652 RepID=A0AAD4KRW4_9EURO|nr:pyridoxal phosphate-dependent transferase [Talaromyces proteolyticus]KAH8695586.1 pyridoxal phosphate-dependent transferase [Talaromyces proteolyticus]